MSHLVAGHEALAGRTARRSRTDARAENDDDEVVDAVAEPEPLLGRRQCVGIVFQDDREPERQLVSYTMWDITSHHG